MYEETVMILNLAILTVALVLTYFFAKTVIRMGLMLVANFLNFFALIGTACLVMFIW